MNYSEYMSPELSILIPVLYAIGAFIKKSSTKNWLIPFILGGVGILLVFAYLISKDYPTCVSEFFGLIFASCTQGIIAAASSVYANNLYKQFTQRNEVEDDD
ncbi:MAG: hypothetical protein A2Y15_05625 [Clostridiales bacterium GWF2_36_10]|nr:MAG: hypothetical protein A2Y15_05625 [Clostridiales bacterium GWF2_36_10]HAN21977.1 hypothetical protein [Clostridiales bacterium]